MEEELHPSTISMVFNASGHTFDLVLDKFHELFHPSYREIRYCKVSSAVALTHAEFRTLHIDAIISHHGVQAHGKHHSGSQGTVRSDELLLSRLRAVLQVEVYAGCVTCAL